MVDVSKVVGYTVLAPATDAESVSKVTGYTVVGPPEDGLAVTQLRTLAALTPGSDRLAISQFRTFAVLRPAPAVVGEKRRVQNINYVVAVAPAPQLGFYALAHKSADQSGTSGVVSFGAEVSDLAGVHDTAVNSSRFTVPAAWNGRYVRFLGNFFSGSTVDITALRNGASFPGAGHGAAQTSGDDGVNAISAPVLTSTGDYFEWNFSSSVSATIYNDEPTWAQLELLPSDFNGAVAQKSAGQALTAGTTTVLTWDTELYDLGGWHDNATNNSRLTVPSGVSLVRLSAGIKGGNVADQLVASMIKNGVTARGLPQADCDTDDEDSITVVSAPIVVTAGDYFEARAFFTNATTVPNADGVWFAIEKLPSDLKYALVHRSSNQAIAGVTTTTVQWNAEVVDTDGWHDNVTNPSRLTVPAGVSRVRVTANLVTEATASGQFVMTMLKNGADFIGSARSESDTAGTDSVNGMSAIVAVVPGDYFEVQVYSTGAIDIGSSVASWFSIEEVREAA